MKMENQNERNGECVKPLDFLAQDKERSSENLEDSDNLCTFVAPEPPSLSTMLKCGGRFILGR